MIVIAKVLGARDWARKDSKQVRTYACEPIGLAEARPVLVEINEEGYSGPALSGEIQFQITGQGFGDRNKLSLVGKPITKGK